MTGVQAIEDALLRAIDDPASITPREPGEPIVSWQRRAVRDGAIPVIRATERERCAQLARDVAASYTDRNGTRYPFAALLEEDHR